MRIFSDIREFKTKSNTSKCGTAVAIGKFDGIHRGHQKLFDVVKSAREKGLKTVVFTFDMPLAAYFTGHEVQVLTTNEERREYLEDMGIDFLIEFPVNDKTVSIEPEFFIKDVLVKSLHARIIAAGSDCSFGKGGRGNLELLEQMETDLGYKTVEVEKVSYDNEIISSTLVRSKVSKGDMEYAKELLAHPYSVSGRVAHGRKLGSSVLSMPTVNIMPDSTKLLPPFGVYFSDVVIGTAVYHGITNIGRKPTVAENDAISVETYIYDFDDDLYGEYLRIELLHWHREEMKFDGLDALKKQMHADMETGRKYFKLS